MYFAAIYNAQNLGWNWYGSMEDCPPFHSLNLPFHSGIFHIPYRNFRSIPFSIPFHTMPWLSILYYYYYCNILPNGCSQIENPEVLDFEKIASASSSFSTLSLPSSLSLPTSFIKVLPLPQKFNRFQLPLPHPCVEFICSFHSMLMKGSIYETCHQNPKRVL